MKIRPQRGGLEESMSRVVELDGTKEAIVEFLNMGDGYLNGRITPEMVELIPGGWDERIGWNTYIVTVNGMAVAFTNGPLTD